MIVGITGGTGCGKSTALRAVSNLGGLCLDCDEIYHELLITDPRLLAAIEARFPGTVENGTLLRRKLGALVYGDPQALRDLNRITHGAVKARVKAILREKQPSFAAIDAIALFEGGLAELCDVTVAVTAPPEDRLARIMARDGVTRDYALSRIQAQQPESFYRARCDHCLENRGTEAEFLETCLVFFRKLATL